MAKNVNHAPLPCQTLLCLGIEEPLDLRRDVEADALLFLRLSSAVPYTA